MNTKAIALYRKISEHQTICARLSAITDQEELTIEIIRLGTGFCLPVTPQEVRTYLANMQWCEPSDDDLERMVKGNGNNNDLEVATTSGNTSR
ncbi:MAG: hypothetical protein JEY79_05945 [Pseudodesulfovibrio sp.]|nr:hypothetical protein [Pseudodesulfovibrio sp.]